jgi:hypothetical protein
MTALTFQPNGDRIDALQVDGEPVGRIEASVYGKDIWLAFLEPTFFQGMGDKLGCQQAIVCAWAKRFPNA